MARREAGPRERRRPHALSLSFRVSTTSMNPFPPDRPRYRNFRVARASAANIAPSSQNRTTVCVSVQPRIW